MSHWKPAILIALAAGLGIAAAWTPLTLDSRLQVEPIPTVDLPIDLPEPLLPPAMVRQRGVETLSGMNDVLGIGALITTFSTIVLLGIMRASGRRAELLVHRAVGASRKRLLRAGIHEGLQMAGIALAIGAALGLLTFEYARAHWPGTVASARSPFPLLMVAAIGTTILLGVVVPLRSIGAMRPQLPPLTPLLAPGLCAIQLAVCFAVLVQSRAGPARGAVPRRRYSGARIAT